MKSDIHPEYHKDAKIICACGNTIEVGSTRPEIHVELCSSCHPFYTGKKVLVDTEGRVEKFQAKQKAKQEKVQTKKQKAEKRAAAKAEKKKAKNIELSIEA